MIAAEDSVDFKRSVDGLSSLSTFLNQYATDGVARMPAQRTAFGVPALDAQTNLFTRKHPKMEHEELVLPEYMDPYGKLMAEVRRRSFCYTTENEVQYGQTDTSLEQS